MFPKNFYWGAATSAHQVEGGNTNNWTEWEKANARRLALETKERFSALPMRSRLKGVMRDFQNYISKDACDHYNRFVGDFDLARSLGHNAHRFSIEWSRIEPKEGVFDESEIEHYRAGIAALRERGMEPFLTLWHWTLPLWLSEGGGILHPKFPEYFERFAMRAGEAFGREVKFWITVNEPEIYCLNSYYRGIWPPEGRGLVAYYRALSALIAGHRRAYSVLKNGRSDIHVGASLNLSWFESAGGWHDDFLKMLIDQIWNFHFIKRVRGTIDFIGLNYYFHNRIESGLNKNANERVSDLGWEIYPEGLYRMLMELKRYQLPIYITENGIADMYDALRAEFIREHIAAMERAMKDGVDVRGYFYWSLLDNFEWDKGFWPRFGLIAVDYTIQKRTIRASAQEYAKIITSHREGLLGP